MDKKKICHDLADLLEKELYTQERWEDRLATVWLALKNNPILELAERLVEHEVQTNVPKIDISALPRTVAGWREISNVVRHWAKDIQRKHAGANVDQAVANVQLLINSFVETTITEEAQLALGHLYNQKVHGILNQYVLDTKAYSIFNDLRQLVMTGFYPGFDYNNNRFALFSYGNEVDSRVYINGRLHRAIDILRQMDEKAFEPKRDRHGFGRPLEE